MLSENGRISRINTDVFYSRGIQVSFSRASAVCRTYSIRTCAHACWLVRAQKLRRSSDSTERTNQPKKERAKERQRKRKKNYIVRNYFLSIVSQEFWYAEGKLRSKVRRPIERKVEKREGTERRVCVYFIYMVEATERCGTYLLIPVKRELVACQSTKGGNRKGGRGTEKERKNERQLGSFWTQSGGKYNRRSVIHVSTYTIDRFDRLFNVPCVNLFD